MPVPNNFSGTEEKKVLPRKSASMVMDPERTCDGFSEERVSQELM